MNSSYIVIRGVLPSSDRADIASEISSIISGKEDSIDNILATLGNMKKSSLYSKKTSVFMMKFSIYVRDIVTDSKIVKLLMKYMDSKDIRYIDGPPSVIVQPPLYSSKDFIRMSVPDSGDHLFGIICIRGIINMKFIKSGLCRSNKSKKDCCILYEFYNLNTHDSHEETEVILKVGDICLWKSEVLFTWSNPLSSISSVAINISTCSKFVSFCGWNLDTNVYKINSKLYNTEEYDYRVNSTTIYSHEIRNRFMVNEDKSRNLVKKYDKRQVIKQNSIIDLSNIVQDYI